MLMVVRLFQFVDASVGSDQLRSKHLQPHPLLFELVFLLLALLLGYFRTSPKLLYLDES